VLGQAESSPCLGDGAQIGGQTVSEFGLPTPVDHHGMTVNVVPGQNQVYVGPPLGTPGCLPATWWPACALR
jgi:hypothetical protein